MKKILNLLVAAAMLTFAACSDNNTVDEDPSGNGGTTTPVFPTKVERSISVDESTTFKLDPTPNMAWTLGVDSRTYFKVEINGEELDRPSRSGEAGTEVTVTVTGRVEDFNESHTMVITLTMGGVTEEIAEVVLMKAGVTFEARAAQLSENGKMVLDNEGNAVYSPEALAEGGAIELSVDNESRVKVLSNRDWKAEASQWLQLSAEGGRHGETAEISLSSPDAIRPFDDAEGYIRFYVDEQTELGRYAVLAKGCGGEFDYQIVNSTNVVLTAAAGTTTGSVTAAYGSKVFFASADGWIKFADGSGFTESAWSDEEKAAGLHTRDFTAEYGKNASEETSRSAYLFCIPRSVAGSLNEEDALTADGQVNEAFAEYKIATYTQQYTIAPRPEDTLLVQSWVGKGDSTPGEPLFAMVQEYAEGNYPEGWWGDAFDNMPALFRLTLADMKYCELAVMDVQNADEFEIVYHPEDVGNEWIREFGMDENGELYRFVFKYEYINPKYDDNGELLSYDGLKWTEPHVPQAYVICKQNGIVTGALIVEIDAESFDIPLHNASTSEKDIGFTVLTAGEFGYSEKYSDVPQYKVNGYDAASDMPDAQGRYSAGALMLTFNSEYNINFGAFDYEPIENGLMAAEIGWPGWKGGNDADVNYIFVDKPMYGESAQITYLFAGNGPDQFRIVCRNKSGKIVCTVYVYYYNDYDWDE